MVNLIFFMIVPITMLTLLMGSMIDHVVDCNTVKNPNLKLRCDAMKNTAWVVVIILPIAVFLPMYFVFGGLGTLNIDNIEKRAERLQNGGVEKLLKKSKAELIDRSKRGNELYQLKLIPKYPLKYLKYEDPSTVGKVYGCFVPTNINRADEAMAWKFYITEEEYNGLEVEA